MATTQRDVARRAGVSSRTVSNVVNGFEFVAPATRARVKRALDELGYRPNPTARALRQGRSGVVVLAVPELVNPYFSELAGAVIAFAGNRGSTVVIEQTGASEELERQVLHRSNQALLADGLIFSPVALSSAEIRRHRSEVPIVFLGEHVQGSSFDHVGIDNVAAARTAVEHLLSSGRRRIGVIGSAGRRGGGGPGGGETGRYRMQGYRQALSAYGLRSSTLLFAAAATYHRANGARAMEQLLSLTRPPDAVFCHNDLLAIGAIRTCADRGVRVPDDVAIIGYDNIEESRYSVPSLSTIAPSKDWIASAAVEQLFKRLDGDKSAPVRLEGNFSLQVRDSTSC